MVQLLIIARVILPLRAVSPARPPTLIISPVLPIPRYLPSCPIPGFLLDPGRPIKPWAPNPTDDNSNPNLDRLPRYLLSSNSIVYPVGLNSDLEIYLFKSPLRLFL